MQQVASSVLTWNPAVYWAIAGGILLSLELLLPGVFFMWVGLAAVGVAVVVAVVTLSAESQWLLFAVLSVVAALIGWRWYQRNAAGSPGPLPEPGAVYVGQSAVVIEPLADGHTRVRLHDSVWLAEGAGLAIGATVRVTGQRGSVLLVTSE